MGALHLPREAAGACGDKPGLEQARAQGRRRRLRCLWHERLSSAQCGPQAANQALEERLSDGSRGADAQLLQASLQEQAEATAAAREVRAR